MPSAVGRRRALLAQITEIEAIEALYHQVKAITTEVHIVRPTFDDAPKWTALQAKIDAILAGLE